jgi:hypothetical protein
MTEPLAPDSYAQFLADLKSRIQTAQFHASLRSRREFLRSAMLTLQVSPKLPHSAASMHP